MTEMRADNKILSAVHDVHESFRVLSQALQPFGASSVTMFIRDPLTPYYLRMAVDYDVMVREVIHGPLSVDSDIGSTMMESMGGNDTQWFSRDKLDVLTSSCHSANPGSREHSLYKRFIDRENVNTSALIRFISLDEVQACVWVNFTTIVTKVSDRVKTELRKLKKSVSKALPRLLEETSSRVPYRIRRLQKLHKAAKHFPESAVGTTIQDYLDEFLIAALEVCGIGDHGFGAVYLLDDHNVLRKAALRGQVAQNAKHSFYVDRREGVVSVAAARRAPVIVDEPSVKLEDLYVSIEPADSLPTLRQVVVPLMLGGDVVGVLNLESKQEQPGFSEVDVFDLMVAGFRVAASIRVAEQTSKAHQNRTISMLKIAERAIVETEPVGLREQLQDWAQNAFGADQCSIWQWCCVSHRFVPESCPEAPRGCGGLSKFIHETNRILWWSASTDPEALDLMFWNEGDGQWSTAVPSHSWLPEGVNEHLKNDGITHQIGVPLLFLDKCVGVVWFKFRDASVLPPLASQVQFVRGVTAEIGLILQLKRQHREFAEEAAVQRKLQEFYSTEFPTGPFKFEGGHGYAIVQSCGPIGGDFYARVDLMDSTGFIVADGENHGVVGATAMLPIYTAFKICAQKFLSPRHTLWRLNDLLEGVDNVRGSAICFLVDCSRSSPRLIVSSAAHPKIMVSRPGMFLSLPKGEEEGFQIGVGRQMYYDNLLEESRFDLEKGDIVVAITDGVSEAGENGASGKFGIDRLSVIIAETRSKGPEAVALAIEQAMLKHCHNAVFDDYTILVIRIT